MGWFTEHKTGVIITVVLTVLIIIGAVIGGIYIKKMAKEKEDKEKEDKAKEDKAKEEAYTAEKVLYSYFEASSVTNDIIVPFKINPTGNPKFLVVDATSYKCIYREREFNTDTALYRNMLFRVAANGIVTSADNTRYLCGPIFDRQCDMETNPLDTSKVKWSEPLSILLIQDNSKDNTTGYSRHRVARKPTDNTTVNYHQPDSDTAVLIALYHTWVRRTVLLHPNEYKNLGILGTDMVSGVY